MLRELRERGDVSAAKLTNRGIKRSELEELSKMTPPLAEEVTDGVWGVTGLGQAFLHVKETKR